MSIESEIKQFIRDQIAAGNGGKIWHQMMKRVKSAAIQQAMEETGNCQSVSARALGVNRVTLRSTAHNTMTPDELRKLGML